MVTKLSDHIAVVADRIDRLTSERGLSGNFPDRLKQLRSKLGMSQDEFSRIYDIPVSNLRNWEQTNRATKPDAAARLLIDMIEADPRQVAEIISRARRTASETTDQRQRA